MDFKMNFAGFCATVLRPSARFFGKDGSVGQSVNIEAVFNALQATVHPIEALFVI
jgi:hypothetical protein